MRKMIGVAAVSLSLLAAACTNNSPGQRAIAGGVIGAGAGAIVGGATGLGPAAGALIGAGGGAAIGAVTH